MKKTKIKLRVLSAFLAFVMVFCSSVFVATAEDTLDEALTATGEASGESISVSESYFEDPDNFIPAVFEVTDRREENVKHFSIPDGTYQAVVYGEAVHRLDESGKWQDIDNRLSLIESKGLSTYSTSDGRVSFVKTTAPSSEGTMLFTLTENGYLVAMAIVGEPSNSLSADAEAVLVSSASVTNHAERAEILVTDTAEEQYNKLANIDNTTEVLYSNIVSDTDIEYTLYSNSVKENIVVKARKDSYVYNFMFAVKGLVASMMPDGSITLSDATTDETVYIIPAPYMTDANGEISHSVTYTLTEINSDMYSLTVTADKEWINADDRAFPVKIDPTITTTPYNVADTFVTSLSPDSNYGPNFYVELVKNTHVGLIYIPLPSLPVGATMTKTELSLMYSYDGSESNYTSILVTIANTSWNEGSVTWESIDDNNDGRINVNDTICGNLASFLEIYLSVSASADSPLTAVLDVTEIAEAWYSGECANNGLLVFSTGPSSKKLKIESVDNYLTRAPKYTVTYVADIQEGVYALKNVDTGKWMSMGLDSTNCLQYNLLQQTAYASTPTLSSNREAFFKISLKPGTDSYIIRPMTNNTLVINPVNMDVWGEKLSTVDSNVSNTDTYSIEFDGNYVILRSNASGNPLISSTTYAGDCLESYAYSAIEPRMCWILERYSGASNFKADVYESTELVAGNNKDLTPIISSTYIGVNTPYMYIESASLDNVGFIWNSTNYTISARPHREGIAYAKIRISDGTTTYHTKSNIILNVSIPFEENIYHIQNSSNQYLFAASTSQIYQSSLYSYTNPLFGKQLWSFEHVVDGYYSITSLGIRDNNTKRDCIALTALSSGSVTLDAFNNEDEQQWKISYTNGQYQIYNKSYSSKTLTFNASSTTISSSVASVNLQEPNLPNCTFEGTYNSGIDESGDLHIQIVIDDSALVAGVTTESMFNVVQYWEQVSDKIHIYMPNETAPADVFVVEFIGTTGLLDPSVLAMTSGIIDDTLFVCDTEGNGDWYSCIINLNFIIGGGLMSFPESEREEVIKKVIVHEMGHALKLAHPLHSDYQSNTTVLALMNQGAPHENEYVVIYPSAHDIYFIKRKWG